MTFALSFNQHLNQRTKKMNEISTVNIWKSDYDNKWNVCMVVQIADKNDIFKRDDYNESEVRGPLYERYRYKFDTYREAVKHLEDM